MLFGEFFLTANISLGGKVELDRFLCYNMYLFRCYNSKCAGEVKLSFKTSSDIVCLLSKGKMETGIAGFFGM